MSEPPIQEDAPPPSDDEPLVEAEIVTNETQAAKWFMIVFAIAVAVLSIFAIIFWIAFVRTSVFGAH